MKSNNQLIKWVIMLLLTISATNTMAQGPYPSTSSTQSVCFNTTQPYYVSPTVGLIYNWTITTLSGGGNGSVISGQGTNEISVSWTSVGTATLTLIETNSSGCDGVPVSIVVTINPTNTILLTSAVGTNAQTVCINTAITPITYETTGATGATVTELPAGVTGTWNANVVTISGTPTASGTFNYLVTLTGGCSVVTATGTITVTPSNTILLTSAVGTNAQTVCINTAITPITYETTGATGATFSGLPAGVTGTWAADVVTISGYPSTVTGSPFTYTVTLTSGCGNVTSTGTITVNLLPTTSPITHN